MKRFVIGGPPSNIRDDIFDNLIRFLETLPEEKKYSVEIKEHRRNRSLEQNAYLHGVALKLICDHTGYEQEDMKTYLLGEFTGWVEYDMFGQRRRRPQMRSHEMNTEQMGQFFEFIWWWASENLNVRIPSPNEE